MSGFFSKLKDRMMGEDISKEVMGETHDGYVELDTVSKDTATKVTVRPFQLDDFEGIKEVLDALREGHTIALINIKALKEKDIVELKRAINKLKKTCEAINKLKKTCDAIEGDIAGFGDDWIAATPNFAHIHRGKMEGKAEGDVAEVTEFND